MTTQSEQILEDDSVARLTAIGYAKVDVTEETSILANLKARLEACNSFSMTAREFNRVLWKQHIRSTNFSSEATSTVGGLFPSVQLLRQLVPSKSLHPLSFPLHFLPRSFLSVGVAGRRIQRGGIAAEPQSSKP